MELPITLHGTDYINHFKVDFKGDFLLTYCLETQKTILNSFGLDTNASQACYPDIDVYLTTNPDCLIASHPVHLDLVWPAVGHVCGKILSGKYKENIVMKISKS